MAELLITAAINIGVNMALNALFPPPTIKQEGPRLSELGFTSAAYGRFVNICFGTDRLEGNLIECTEPAIEEVINTETRRAGKGGGQKVSQTTYTYYFTGTIAFAASGPSQLLRLWADGKIIYDVTGTSGAVVKEGFDIQFYPGGEGQLPDPEEEARRGADTLAYRHLVRVKFNRIPLADFGNRIPNFTAEISFASGEVATGLSNTITSDSDVQTYIGVDPYRRRAIALNGNGFNVAIQLSDLADLGLVGSSSFTTAGYDWQGGVYCSCCTGNNAQPLTKYDLETGEMLWQLGWGSNGTDDLVDRSTGTIRFVRLGLWIGLTVNDPYWGPQNMVLHHGEGVGNAFSIVYADGVPNGTEPLSSGYDDAALGAVCIATSNIAETVFSTFSMVVIPDHDRGCYYVFENDTANTIKVWKITFEFAVQLYFAADAYLAATPTYTHIGTLSRNTATSDFQGTGGISGWAVNRSNGQLILCNSTTTIIYEPDSDTVLAKDTPPVFTSHYNYFSTDRFGYIWNQSSLLGYWAVLIDTRTLEVIQEVSHLDLPILTSANYDASAWDEYDQSVIFRVSLTDVHKVYLGRSAGNGVDLADVVTSLCTDYNDMTLGQLTGSDIEVSGLVGETVHGFTVNNRSSLKDALEPLRQRFFFDMVQSDWTIKFVPRGGTPLLTIPSADVGAARKGSDKADSPVKETRAQDIELPMRVVVRYRNKDFDYSVDMEQDKRQRSPVASMSSLSEITIDLPLVDEPTNIRRVAQNTLFTAWKERRQIATELPWTYLELDPTDIVEITVFDEVLRTRLSELDVGADLTIDIKAVVEAARTYESSITSGIGLGYVPKVIPSLLQPKLIFMDAPLLSMIDYTADGTLSRAYVAMQAYEDGWPGGVLYRSQDGVAFSPATIVPNEANVARVSTAPSAWGYNEEGDFPNRWQEISDGGSIVLRPMRNADAWDTATELAVYNGANVIAVKTASGVEIIQFQTATPNADGTITLSRLLRGRLGTEDIADAGGPAAGDYVMLLTDQNGTANAASIVPTNLSVSLLNQSLQYRGVTSGTFQENAQVEAFTYTGRDLKPFSPVHVTAVYDDPADELDVTWVRRNRGPNSAEWLDGTGVVPSLETIEQYVVSLYDSAGVLVTSATVNDTTSYTFTGLLSLSTGGSARVEVVQVGGGGQESPPGTCAL